MNNLPTGTVTFLFTDIEGSTPLYLKFPEATPRAIARHLEILREAIERHGGRVFNIIGDAVCAAFTDPQDALVSALEGQRALFHENWGEIGSVRVRMGLHTGQAEAQGDDYVTSLTLVRVQRFMNAGHGGQILLSAATLEHVGAELPSGVTVRELGEHKLRGLTHPEQIYQLIASDLPSEFPPLRVAEAPTASDSSALLEQLVRHKLVGRTSELAQLQQQLSIAQQAREQLVLVSGEPGVGKTRLANELLAYARQTGAVVLRGGCYEYEATTPYLPIVEALREWVHWQSDETLKAYLNGTAPELAKLAPEIESKLGPQTANAPLPPTEERLRLFDNVARFLSRLAAAHGLVIFLDDLHWADQGTLGLLHYLVRHLRNERVMILGAYREVELDRMHPLATALVEWNRERIATRISLTRLSRDDTGLLLATLFGQTTISTDFSAALYRETEGNPFFVEEVVKALIEQGEIYRENENWNRKQIAELAIPQSVKEAIGRRLSRLSDGCIEMLRTAAALGKVFRYAELSASARANEEELLDALDEATAAQLLRANSNDTFAFTHDKIREVLYEELNPIRRRRLHQRIGETLENLYTDGEEHVSDLAYHFMQSGDLARSLDYAMRAAKAAARVFAYDDALKFYEQAHESAEALQRTDTLAEIEEKRGDIRRMRGEIAPAVAHYEQGYALATTTAQRATLHVKIGLAYSPVGDMRGIAALEQALTELDQERQGAQLAFALALIGRHHHYHTEHYKALEFLERARVIAEPLDSAPTLETIYSFMSGTYQHLTRYAESNEWARRCIALGERKNHAEARALGYEFLAENAAGCGYWDETLDYAAQDRAIGLGIGSMARVAWADFPASTALHGKGDLRVARQTAMRGLEIAEQLGENRLASGLEPLLARILTDLGDAAEAKKYAERGFAHSEELGQIVLGVWARHGLGYWHLMRGEFEEAARLCEEAMMMLKASETRGARNQIGAFAAVAFLQAGRIEEAEATVEGALALAEEARTPHYVAMAHSAQGLIWAAQARHDDARHAFDQAIAIFEQQGTRVELARALRHRAKLMRARSPESAEADAQRAEEILAECGAVAGDAVLNHLP